MVIIVSCNNSSGGSSSNNNNNNNNNNNSSSTHNFKTRPGGRPCSRPGFRVLTGQGLPGQFFLKSKRCRFNKKKYK